MALAVILALGSALAYGVSDFLGGTAAARLRVIPTTILSYVTATVALTILILVTGGVWSGAVLLWGSVAGVAAVVGFVTFYAAMAIGPMSLVSPLIAVLGSAVPVVAAVAFGEQLSLWAWAGIVFALAGAVLISSQPKGGGGRMTIRAAVLSVIAGVSLGTSVIALDRAPADSGSLAALQTGSLAIVSVLVGLYPLATLLLARIVGGERMTRLQLTGAGLAIAASAVLGLALGGAA